MLLGCQLAHLHSQGQPFRSDESQDNRLAEPRQPKFTLEQENESIATERWHSVSLDAVFT